MGGVGPDAEVMGPCELPQAGIKPFVPIHLEYFPKIPKDMHIIYIYNIIYYIIIII